MKQCQVIEVAIRNKSLNKCRKRILFKHTLQKADISVDGKAENKCT